MVKMHCLITGGMGLIGSHLIESLEKQYEIYLICRNPKNVQDSLVKRPNIHLIEGDLTKLDWIDSLPPKIDAIFHLAQSEHFREFPDYVNEVFAVNTVSVLRLLDEGRKRGLQKFILAGSGGIYGSREKECSSDSELVLRNDLGFYLTSKLCAEFIAQNYSKLLDVVILRFFFVYGAGQKRDMLIPRLVDNILHDRPITLQGENGLLINPVHVSDAIAALKSALLIKGSHVVNVAGREVLSLREISEIIGKEVGKSPHFHSDFSKEPSSLIGGIQEMKLSLDVEPLTSFATGIKDVIPFSEKRQLENCNMDTVLA